MTYFRTCSTRRCRSQAPLCHYTLRLVSNQAEGTFARLRYYFWRRPPQSNCPPDIVPTPDHGVRLVFQICQGGISRLAPSRPESRVQSLPPILRKQTRKTVSSCSKGSRGLSVLPRVKGIFTPSATSLRASPRQWGSRYAIRAGRNLPDKEFRYLRTVIVTAAVYRGFGSPLHLAIDGSP